MTDNKELRHWLGVLRSAERELDAGRLAPEVGAPMPPASS